MRCPSGRLPRRIDDPPGEPLANSAVQDATREFRISVQGLDKGMFVSRLDRPWIGTGFPLEGLKVNTDDELRTLRSLCAFVYIDATRGTTPDLRYVAFDEDPIVRHARNEEEIAGLRRREWQVATEFREEIAQASESHALLQSGIHDVLRDVQSGGRIDAARLGEGIDAMIESITRNPAAFPWVMELRRRSEYSYQHALGCSVWAATFGRHLGMERHDLRELAMGGLLIDVGKVRLPEALLNKVGPLTADEVRWLRSHVEKGVSIVEGTPGISGRVVEMVANHHERFDGSGYPRGLREGDIPIDARIMGLIDSYDAMTGTRPYAVTRSPHQAVMELYQARDRLFQAELVEQFIRASGIYPTGSLVELSDGSVGVVMSVHALRRLRPLIMLLLDDRKRPLPEFRQIDLATSPRDARGELLNIRGGLAQGAFGIDPAALFLD